MVYINACKLTHALPVADGSSNPTVKAAAVPAAAATAAAVTAPAAASQVTAYWTYDPNTRMNIRYSKQPES
jgi:hypothetical protein